MFTSQRNTAATYGSKKSAPTAKAKPVQTVKKPKVKVANRSPEKKVPIPTARPADKKAASPAPVTITEVRPLPIGSGPHAGTEGPQAGRSIRGIKDRRPNQVTAGTPYTGKVRHPPNPKTMIKKSFMDRYN